MEDLPLHTVKSTSSHMARKVTSSHMARKVVLKVDVSSYGPDKMVATILYFKGVQKVEIDYKGHYPLYTVTGDFNLDDLLKAVEEKTRYVSVESVEETPDSKRPYVSVESPEEPNNQASTLVQDISNTVKRCIIFRRLCKLLSLTCDRKDINVQMWRAARVDQNKLPRYAINRLLRVLKRAKRFVLECTDPSTRAFSYDRRWEVIELIEELDACVDILNSALVNEIENKRSSTWLIPLLKMRHSEDVYDLHDLAEEDCRESLGEYGMHIKEAFHVFRDEPWVHWADVYRAMWVGRPTSAWELCIRSTDTHIVKAGPHIVQCYGFYEIREGEYGLLMEDIQHMKMVTTFHGVERYELVVEVLFQIAYGFVHLHRNGLRSPLVRAIFVDDDDLTVKLLVAPHIPSVTSCYTFEEILDKVMNCVFDNAWPDAFRQLLQRLKQEADIFAIADTLSNVRKHSVRGPLEGLRWSNPLGDAPTTESMKKLTDLCDEPINLSLGPECIPIQLGMSRLNIREDDDPSSSAMKELKEICEAGDPIKLSPDWELLPNVKELLKSYDYVEDPEDPYSFLKQVQAEKIMSIRLPTVVLEVFYLPPNRDAPAEWKPCSLIQLDSSKLPLDGHVWIIAHIPMQPPKEQPVVIRIQIQPHVKLNADLCVHLQIKQLLVGVPKSHMLLDNISVGYYPSFIRFTLMPLLDYPSVPLYTEPEKLTEKEDPNRRHTNIARTTDAKLGPNYQGWGPITFTGERAWGTEAEVSETQKLVTVVPKEGNAASMEWSILRWPHTGTRYNAKKPHAGIRPWQSLRPPFTGGGTTPKINGFPGIVWHLQPEYAGKTLKFMLHLEVEMHLIWFAGKNKFFRRPGSSSISFEFKRELEVKPIK